MTPELVEKAIAELRECWPYQQIPDTHLRHWRDVFGTFPRDVVRKVLHDCSITMTGRPGWGEFGKLCGELALVEARKAQHGPLLDPSDPDITPPAEIHGLIAQLKDPESALRQVGG